MISLRFMNFFIDNTFFELMKKARGVHPPADWRGNYLVMSIWSFRVAGSCSHKFATVHSTHKYKKSSWHPSYWHFFFLSMNRLLAVFLLRFKGSWIRRCNISYYICILFGKKFIKITFIQKYNSFVLMNLFFGCVFMIKFFIDNMYLIFELRLQNSNSGSDSTSRVETRHLLVMCLCCGSCWK